MAVKHHAKIVTLSKKRCYTFVTNFKVYKYEKTIKFNRSGFG